MEEEISDEQVEELLGQLTQCHEACIQTLAHSIRQGGDLADYDHISNLIDCSEICQVAESFFLRESTFGGDILDLCADICDECAENCDKFKEDRVLVSCAAICRNCAKICEKIIYSEDSEEAEE